MQSIYYGKKHKRKISIERENDVSLITCDIIKPVSQRFKPSKTDPLLCVTSDFFVNAPIILYYLLSIIIKSYFIYGYVNDFLLISTFLPNVKGKLADAKSSNNYRSIASGLITKIFDWLIILAYMISNLVISLMSQLHVHLVGNWNYIVFYAKWFRSVLMYDGYE